MLLIIFRLCLLMPLLLFRRCFSPLRFFIRYYACCCHVIDMFAALLATLDIDIYFRASFRHYATRRCYVCYAMPYYFISLLFYASAYYRLRLHYFSLRMLPCAIFRRYYALFTMPCRYATAVSLCHAVADFHEFAIYCCADYAMLPSDTPLFFADDAQRRLPPADAFPPC